MSFEYFERPQGHYVHLSELSCCRVDRALRALKVCVYCKISTSLLCEERIGPAEYATLLGQGLRCSLRSSTFSSRRCSRQSVGCRRRAGDRPETLKAPPTSSLSISQNDDKTSRSDRCRLFLCSLPVAARLKQPPRAEAYAARAICTRLSIRSQGPSDLVARSLDLDSLANQ